MAWHGKWNPKKTLGYNTKQNKAQWTKKDRGRKGQLKHLGRETLLRTQFSEDTRRRLEHSVDTRRRRWLGLRRGAGLGLAEDLEQLAGVGRKSSQSRFTGGNVDHFQAWSSGLEAVQVAQQYLQVFLPLPTNAGSQMGWFIPSGTEN